MEAENIFFATMMAYRSNVLECPVVESLPYVPRHKLVAPWVALSALPEQLGLREASPLARFTNKLCTFEMTLIHVLPAS